MVVMFITMALATAQIFMSHFYAAVADGQQHAALANLASGPAQGGRIRGQSATTVESQVCSRFETTGLYKQAETDFQRYRAGLTNQQHEAYEAFCEKYAKHGCMTIIIVQGRIFVRHFFPGYQSRHRITLHAIYRVAQRFGPLPDVQFVVEVTDGMFYQFDLPLFVVARPRAAQTGVLYPDFTFYSWPEAVCPPERSHAYGYLYNQYARDAMGAELQPEADWSRRQDTLFWRGGRVANNARTQAVNTLQGKPGVDVAFMEWHNTSITGGNGAPGCVGLHDHCKYRYLAFLNGNTYSSRFKYQLLCGSCVFASAQDWIEWWTHLFAAEEDYIQVNPDWSDSPQRLAQVRARPDGGRKVAESGRRKALEVLSEDAVDCYWFRLIREAAKILPPPMLFNIEDLPPSTKPIEDVLLYPNGAAITDSLAIGPVEPVR